MLIFAKNVQFFRRLKSLSLLLRDEQKIAHDVNPKHMRRMLRSICQITLFAGTTALISLMF